MSKTIICPDCGVHIQIIPSTNASGNDVKIVWRPPKKTGAAD